MDRDTDKDIPLLPNGHHETIIVFTMSLTTERLEEKNF